uniref:4-hydroxybenzoate polyprenyltransferase, mitochondrial n=1 Tax=Chrysotila carterae TaxID=13221 RepID=A0A7S4F3H9_CHRCT|mmetsp:Transcript_28141/g.61616  ORF Transcript_28141/g.61616 Transcript_28141/m.61616 type:complete len:366 (+) Transcript_28141:813-1910(+)
MHRWLPPAAVPYALLGRWDRPIGTWLLLWPCLWSIGLSAGPGHLPDVRLCALFTLGAFMMRGAGCTINDIWDRDFDRQVERTRHRPLASGALNVKQALAFLSAQLSVSLGVLVQLPPAAIATGLVSTPLWALYPLAKRFTDWPQAVLGIAINWGVLLGSVAVHGQPDWQMVLPLYLASFAWTLHYDTIYAHQDAKDDARAGVRSSALALGKRTKPFLIGCGVVCIGGIGAAGAASGEAALLMPLSAGALHLAWQTRTLDLNSRESCLRLFRSNRDFGAIVFAAIVACKLISLASDGGDGGGSSSGAGSLHSGSSEGGSGGSGSADGGDDGGSSSSSHIGSGRGRGDMNEKRAHSSAEHVDTEDTC